jgi:hypothetical protein
MFKNSLILIFVIQLLLNINPVIYEWKRNAKDYKLILNDDSTYVYTYNGPTVISGNKPYAYTFFFGKPHYWTAKDSGKWKLNKDTLMLIDSIKDYENKSSITGKYSEGQFFVSVLIVDEKNKPISGVEVALNSNEHFKKTDSLGHVLFSYSEFKKHHENERDYIIESVDCKFDKDWVDNQYLDDPNVNEIKIVHDLNPVFKKQVRIRKLIIKKNSLIFKDPSGFKKRRVVKLRKVNT